MTLGAPARRCRACDAESTDTDASGLCEPCRASLAALLDEVAADEDREFVSREAERAHWRDRV